MMVSDYTQTTLALCVIFLGMGIVASALSVVWTAAVHRSWPDWETMLGLTKIYMGMAVAAIIVAVVYRYALS